MSIFCQKLIVVIKFSYSFKSVISEIYCNLYTLGAPYFSIVFFLYRLCSLRDEVIRPGVIYLSLIILLAGIIVFFFQEPLYLLYYLKYLYRIHMPHLCLNVQDLANLYFLDSSLSFLFQLHL